MRFLTFFLPLLFVLPTFGSATRVLDGQTITNGAATVTVSTVSGTEMVSAGIVQEVPSGTVNSSNLSFTMSFSPAQTATILLFVNGLLQKQTTHYTVSGSTITFTSGNAPSTGSDIVVWYSRL